MGRRSQEEKRGMAADQRRETRWHGQRQDHDAENHRQQELRAEPDLGELGEPCSQWINLEIPGMGGPVLGGVMIVGILMQVHARIAQMQRCAEIGSPGHHVPMEVQAHELDQQQVHGAEHHDQTQRGGGTLHCCKASKSGRQRYSAYQVPGSSVPLSSRWISSACAMASRYPSAISSCV
jgi:hypothetical protein